MTECPDAEDAADRPASDDAADRPAADDAADRPAADHVDVEDVGDDRVPAEVADLLHHVYAAFNARDIEALLPVMSPDIDWPNVIDSVRLHGPDSVRQYWLRQFETTDPRVEPVRLTVEPDGRIAVDVHQVVRNLDGDLLADQMVQHVYTVRDGLVERMDVRPAG